MEDSPDFQKDYWEPEKYFPTVTAKIQTLNWQEAPNKNWRTRATGLYASPLHKQFLKGILTDIDKDENGPTNRVTFVDQDMLHAEKETSTEYGKAVSRQQGYL